MVTHFERKTQERNKKLIYGVHVPLKNWEEAVERWKYHWHILRYLPIDTNSKEGKRKDKDTIYKIDVKRDTSSYLSKI